MKLIHKKKIYSIIILLFVLVIMFSGCTENKNSLKNSKINIYNDIPIAKIFAPTNAYFGEKIKFDASKSYDKDGEIISYEWYFGDGNKAKGVIVDHIYLFENNNDVDYPIIYTVFLYITDNEGLIKITDQTVKLFPKKFTFYFSSQKLTLEKPSIDIESIKNSGILNVHEVEYVINNSVAIQKCNWNASIYISKSILTNANKIFIKIYDINGNEIGSKGEKIAFTNLWRDKKIIIKGVCNQNFNLKSIKISIQGFSIRNKINILYGGEKSSQISFDFNT